MTVGLSLSGNESGMTLADFLAATEADKVFARRTASVNLAAAGAHYIIDTIAQLPEVVLDINARLARGERP